MQSKQQVPVSAVKELATSLMSRCLVALLSVGREDGLEKECREMLFLSSINTLLCFGCYSFLF
jgi:hypothetical protein